MPGQLKRPVRIELERKPNVARVGEVLRLPAVPHIDEAAGAAAGDRQDECALRVERGIGIGTDTGIVAQSPRTEDMVGTGELCGVGVPAGSAGGN